MDLELEIVQEVFLRFEKAPFEVLLVLHTLAALYICIIINMYVCKYIYRFEKAPVEVLLVLHTLGALPDEQVLNRALIAPQ